MKEYREVRFGKAASFVWEAFWLMVAMAIGACLGRWV